MEESYTKGFPVSWDQMHRDSKALAWRLAEQGPWRQIISITRGGMVPACIVARELDVRLVDTICIKTYDHQDRVEPQILKGVSEDYEDLLILSLIHI